MMLKSRSYKLETDLEFKKWGENKYYCVIKNG